MGDLTENTYRARFGWERVTWGTHCSNCLSTCSYRVFSADGSVRWEEQAGTFLATEEGVPDRNPMGCQKGAAWNLQVNSGDRLLYPMRRVGPRGSAQWERITWDEALQAVADAILDAIVESGPEVVLVDEGPEGGMLTIGSYMRFASLLGATSLDGNATVNDFPAGHYITFGSMAGGSAAEDTFHADLVLVWHANPAYTRIPYFHYLSEARYSGTEIVLIAPDYSASAIHADYFVPIGPGTDAALALAMCQVLVEEGLVDTAFVCSQTDLPLLVRTDTRRFLRHADVDEGGAQDAFYVWDGDDGRLRAVQPDCLGYDRQPALQGTFSVELASGQEVEVAPAFELLCERLDSYSPESASRHCGVHPDTIRLLARKVACSKTKLHEGFDTAKHYHGDLMERSMDLLLALSGNWGRKGTGFDTFCSFPLDGSLLLDLKPRPGLEAAEEVIASLRSFFGADGDDARNGFSAAAYRAFARMAALGATETPPFFFWLDHCGYADIWSRQEWGASPRPFEDHVREARPGWAQHIRPGPDRSPRVLLEVGTNALRRTRGGARMLLKNLWPSLSMIVSIDTRMNTAGMHADILLPAAHEAERVNIQYPISHSLELVLSDKAIEPAGEARSDWQIFADLTAAIATRARDRGLGDRSVGKMKPCRLADIGDAFTFGGAIRTDHDAVDEIVRDTALTGVLDPEASLAWLRERGWAPIVGNGVFPSGSVVGSQMNPNETFCGFRWHVEDLAPFPTLTGRASFYVDHPWFIEAGEELPCHKPPPATGGDHPFVLTGGHPRWSIHACNATNPVLLETTRGHPTLVMNSADAAGLELRDDDSVRVSNDLGAFTVRARLSPAVRPGQVILYASWEPYGFEKWADGTQVEAGMVKWLHLATGWGHFEYTPLMWQPTPFDRMTRVDVALPAR